MPSALRVSWARFRVYMMIFTAACTLGVLVYLLAAQGGTLRRTVTIRTYMEDTAGVGKKAPVRLNGIPVGHVRNLRLSGSADRRRNIEVELAIQHDLLAQVAEDSIAGLSAENVLGDKYIDIRKGKSPRSVPPGGEIPAEHPKNALESRADLMKLLQAELERLNTILGDIETGKGGVGKFVKGEEVYTDVLGRLSDIQRGVAALGRPGTTTGGLIHDDSVYQSIREPVKRLDDMLAGLQRAEGSGGHFLKDPAVYDDAQRSIAGIQRDIKDLRANKFVASDETYRQLKKKVDSLESSIDALNAGEGGLGHLLVSADLYESLNGSTRELQKLLKEIRTDPRKFLRVKIF